MCDGRNIYQIHGGMRGTFSLYVSKYFIKDFINILIKERLLFFKLCRVKVGLEKLRTFIYYFSFCHAIDIIPSIFFFAHFKKHSDTDFDYYVLIIFCDFRSHVRCIRSFMQPHVIMHECFLRQFIIDIRFLRVRIRKYSVMRYKYRKKELYCVIISQRGGEYTKCARIRYRIEICRYTIVPRMLVIKMTAIFTKKLAWLLPDSQY